jgi:hypothetical protein
MHNDLVPNARVLPESLAVTCPLRNLSQAANKKPARLIAVRRE